MEVLIKIAQLILSLSILVILHEFGHFAFAKLFKTRVEKFYLFFNPWFSVFKFRFKETEYGLGWLPLGGYVKITGMIDESMDREQMEKPAQPWEFRSKPAWQRLLIMVGGVVVNFILALVIYSLVLFTWGESYLKTEDVKYGIMCDSLGLEMGLQNGDKILSIDGKYIDNFNKVFPELILEQAKTIEVERSGVKTVIDVDSDLYPRILNSKGIFMPRFPFVVAKVADGSVADQAGFQAGDQFMKINGESAFYWDEVKELLEKYRTKEVVATVSRGGSELDLMVAMDSTGKIGVYTQDIASFFEFTDVKYGFLESIPAGINKGVELTHSYLKQLKIMVKPENKAYKQVGSFITIGSQFSPTWDWERFWNWTAFLSIILAVMNLLPIPALDGGHVLFLLYEIITGRKPSEKFLEYAQVVGMLLVLGLVVLAFTNDIIRLITNQL